MRKFIIGLLVALAVVAISAESRPAFADPSTGPGSGVAPVPARTCFPGALARAHLTLDGYARVGAGIGSGGAVLFEVWANHRDGRFMIVTVDAADDRLCIAVAGVNWQSHRGAAP